MLVNNKQIQLSWDLFNHCYEETPISTLQEEYQNVISAVLLASLEIKKIITK
jgi:hypothetical protein